MHILIVEDAQCEEIQFSFLVTAIHRKKMGAHCIHATSGTRALLQFNSSMSLVIIAGKLQDMESLKLVDSIRTHQHGSHTPIVMFSEAGTKIDKNLEEKSRNFLRILTKPINVNTFYFAVNSLIPGVWDTKHT
jgi:DNA-binding response OmpR family regulator